MKSGTGSIACLILTAAGWAVLAGAFPIGTAGAQEATAVTTDPGMEYHPRWSPDGTRLAFTARRDGEPVLATMRPDGGDVEVILSGRPGDLHLTWCPDGDRIIFDARPEGSYAVFFLLELATGAVQPLTGGENRGFHPSCSPVGDRIVCSDGDRLHLLTFPEGVSTPLTGGSFGDIHPAFSPDGATVVYTSERFGNPDLFLIPTAGGEPRRLTDHRGNDDWARFSPDGTRIVFNSDRTGNRELWILELDGGRPIRFTHGPGNSWQADWSPDGDRIAFVSDRGGTLDIWTIAAPGR